MNDSLSKEARALLEELVVGDRPREDAAVRELAASDEAFRTRLDELDEVRTLLNETADDARRTRDEARDWTDAPGERDMDRAVGLSPSAPTLVGGARWPRVALLAGLAAASVALLSWLGGGSDPEDPIEPVYMGPDTLSLVHPKGRVESYAPIRWEGELPPGGEFHVLVTDATGAHPATDPLIETRTRATYWTPTAAELARLTPRIRVELRLLAGDGDELERVSTRAER